MRKILSFILFFCFLTSPADATWVRSYVKKDGTFVSGHWRRSGKYSRGGIPSFHHYNGSLVSDGTEPLLKYPLDCKNSVITTSAEISNNKTSGTYVNYPAKTQQTENNWPNIYKKAAILKGDLSHLNKVNFISQYNDSKILWENIREEFIFCHEDSCFIKWIIEPWHWDSINKKIDNLYNYISETKV